MQFANRKKTRRLSVRVSENEYEVNYIIIVMTYVLRESNKYIFICITPCITRRPTLLE